MGFTQQRNYLFHMDSSETSLCHEDMGMFERETPKLNTNTSLFYWWRHMTSCSWYQPRNDHNVNWCHEDICTLWTSGKQKMDSRLFFVLRKCQFVCADHQMWAATDQQVTKNTWQSVLKKVTLNLSSHLLLIFHPSSLSRTFPNARLHDKTAIFWLFPSPAPSGYQLCESSDKGKWLRTVWVLGGLWVWDDIETVHSVLLASL